MTYDHTLFKGLSHKVAGAFTQCPGFLQTLMLGMTPQELGQLNLRAFSREQK